MLLVLLITLVGARVDPVHSCASRAEVECTKECVWLDANGVCAESCPRGVYLPRTNTCCSSGVPADSPNPKLSACFTWQGSCNPLTGTGCCCNQNGFRPGEDVWGCVQACSPLAPANCVNRTTNPQNGTGCAAPPPAPTPGTPAPTQVRANFARRLSFIAQG